MEATMKEIYEKAKQIPESLEHIPDDSKLEEIVEILEHLHEDCTMHLIDITYIKRQNLKYEQQ